MDNGKTINIQIDYHQSGRWTLKEKSSNENMWSDVREPGLLGNLDAASFYKSVALRLASHAQNNIIVETYHDGGPELFPNN